MIKETLELTFEDEAQQRRFHALLMSDIALHLDRAYRALCRYAMASEINQPLNDTACYYHAPTVAAAKRWVAERQMEMADE